MSHRRTDAYFVYPDYPKKLQQDATYGILNRQFHSFQRLRLQFIETTLAKGFYLDGAAFLFHRRCGQKAEIHIFYNHQFKKVEEYLTHLDFYQNLSTKQFIGKHFGILTQALSVYPYTIQ